MKIKTIFFLILFILSLNLFVHANESFSDIEATAGYLHEVNTLSENGIIEGD